MYERIALYYMSDKAYDHLTDLGVTYGYIRPGMLRTRGISSFINAMSESTFLDTRPDHVRERHEQQIAYGRAPTWSTHFDRRARSLKLSEDCVKNLVRLALQVEIIRDEPYVVGGPSRLSPTAIIGFVLESIGLEWITPTNIPTKVYELEEQRAQGL